MDTPRAVPHASDILGSTGVSRRERSRRQLVPLPCFVPRPSAALAADVPVGVSHNAGIYHLTPSCPSSFQRDVQWRHYRTSTRRLGRV